MPLGKLVVPKIEVSVAGILAVDVKTKCIFLRAGQAGDFHIPFTSFSSHFLWKWNAVGKSVGFSRGFLFYV